MKQFELNAEPREDVGRGASRRLRRTGKIPGVLYGGDMAATAITLDHDDLAHHLENEAFYSHILTLKLGKDKQKVVLKDLQRHPIKPNLLHIDFQRINEAEELTMRVPIHFLNEDKCIGVKQGGGVINHILTEIEVVCLPKDLPEYIEVDMHDLDVGDSIQLNEMKFPEGVKSWDLEHGGDPDATVASVYIPREIPEEEEELEAALMEEEGAIAAPAGEEEPEAESEEGEDDEKSSAED